MCIIYIIVYQYTDGLHVSFDQVSSTPGVVGDSRNTANSGGELLIEPL
jgi:hypothetical protein